MTSIDPTQIVRKLEQKHRDAMLDLILAWGSLDGALGMLLARIKGIEMHIGADQIGKLRGSAKITEMVKILRVASGGENLAKKFRRHKKTYERYSGLRDKIAHAHCAGYLASSEDHVVFAVFERVVGSDLAIDAVPIESMVSATKWANAFTQYAMRIVNRTAKPKPT